MGAEAFEQLFGAELVQAGGQTVKVREALAGVDAVGIYFSAHWCPPCRGFTPKLAERYASLKAAGKSLEIVFVSSDGGEEEFNEYHQEMPWLALPYVERERKQLLSDKFGVSGIPTLVFLDGDTVETITDDGRSAVLADSFLQDFPFHPKPVNDLAAAQGLSGDSLIVLMEELPEADQHSLAAALEEVAVQELARPDKERTVQAFYTGKSGGLATKLREVCALPAAGAAAGTPEPAMLLLLLNGDGPKFIAADKQEAALTAQSMRDFLAAFKDGSLEGKPLIEE